MHGNDPATLTAFFTAVTGAAAALVGLLFVAVSINLSNILSGPAMLAARAAETLVVLVFVVISSALSLIPQDVRVLGVEILVLAVPLTVITVRNQLKFQRQNPDSPLKWSVSRVASSGGALVPGTIAGVSLTAHWGGGLYWLALTALLGIVGAVYSAWVLLVEIVR
jgi:hypothetical protein